MNQWESMSFHKLILDFENLAMGLVKNILSYYLEIKSFITQGLQYKLQEILFKINSKTLIF